MKIFFEEIKNLLYHIRSYGKDKYLENGGSEDKIDPLELCKFTNSGFKIAQLKVLEL